MLRREKKRIHHRKNRAWERGDLEEIERLQQIKDVKGYYRRINEARKIFLPKRFACRGKEGVLSTGKSVVLERCTQHFDDLLNGMEGQDPESLRNREPCGVLHPRRRHRIRHLMRKLGRH